jgi:GR25 family glycosyltransferase involved in LPS biosynthesis
MSLKIDNYLILAGSKAARFAGRSITSFTETLMLLAPESHEIIYRSLRRVYRMLPIRHERKRHLADMVVGGSALLRSLSSNIEGKRFSRNISKNINQRSCFSTDVISIVSDEHLLAFKNVGEIARNIHLSLTVTPTRAMSEEFFDVLSLLVNQTHEASNIFLALPKSYRRNFDIDWDLMRPIVIKKISERFGNRITVITCEDEGPGTKLLGLLAHISAGNALPNQDRIIIVDDDIFYSSSLVRIHEICHAIYQCDVATINQDLVIKEWFPLRFNESKSLFADRDGVKVFGWLSFSVRIGAFLSFPKFFEHIVEEIPEARFHDDAIFSAYIRQTKLYTTQILATPLKSASRTRISEDNKYALKFSNLSDSSQRKIIEARIDELLISNAVQYEQIFYIPALIQPRPIKNCEGLFIRDQSSSISVIGHWTSARHILLSVTVFDKVLLGSNKEIWIECGADRFTVNLLLQDRKFTVLLETCRDVFTPLEVTNDLPLIQTFETNDVSRFQYYAFTCVLNQGPKHSYCFFNDKKRIEFINSHYTQQVVLSYQSLIPGAYRADLFRYLYAYIHPCIYIDLKVLPTLPLAALFNQTDKNYLFIKDNYKDYIAAHIFINMKSYNSIFRDAILITLHNIFRQNYANDSLSISGPGVLASALNNLTQYKPKLFNVYKKNDWKHGKIIDKNAEVYFFNAYEGYYEENNYLKTEHYSFYYNNKNVFKYVFDDFLESPEKFISGVDSILWINLDRSSDRRSEMEKIFEKLLSVPNFRIEAVDGQKNIPIGIKSIRDALATPYEEACLLSHLQALERARELQGEIFLILEDDITLHFFPFLSEQDVISRIIARAPTNWEIIQIAWLWKSELSSEFTDWNALMREGIQISSTAAYIINRTGLNKIFNTYNRDEFSNFVFDTKKMQQSSSLPDGKWFLSDYFIYQNCKTYIYKNKIFTTLNKDSTIHGEHLDWQISSQNVTYNKFGDHGFKK